MVDAEGAAAAAIERLLAERLAVKDVVHLTGRDPATVRRLRQLGTDSDATGGDATDETSSDCVGTTGEGADAELA